MSERVLNIVPSRVSNEIDLARREYAFLDRMTEEQRLAYHSAYDPDNEEYRRRRKRGELKGDSDELARYKYQRFMRDYLGCVAAIDDNVGRILEFLDEKGSADNTVLIYSSDQGFFTGEHGWNDKRWMYEESFSTPLLLRWPARVQQGRRSKALVQNIDYAPTFLELAGAKIPEGVDGRSLVPLLGGDPPRGWRRSLYYHYYDDGAYNLPRFEGVLRGRYKLINYYYPAQAWELFDLGVDPHEMRSVYSDVSYQGVVLEMKRELERLRKKYDVPTSGGSMPLARKPSNPVPDARK